MRQVPKFLPVDKTRSLPAEVPKDIKKVSESAALKPARHDILGTMEQSNETHLPQHSTVLVFFFSLLSSCNPASPSFSSSCLRRLTLEGSQRISDSEISDYDCEDGVGVITGKDCSDMQGASSRRSVCRQATPFLAEGTFQHSSY